jgi:DNA-binding NarL/FixJ family response regulator
VAVSGHEGFLVVGGGATTIAAAAGTQQSATAATTSVRIVVSAGATGPHWKRIRRCFAGSPYRTVVRSSSSEAGSILDECRSFLPCVLLIDEDSLMRVDPLLFARKAEYGRIVPVLVLLNNDHAPRSLALLQMGCMGFLHPKSPPWQLRRAVEAVASGELWAPRLLLSQICRDYLSAHDPCKLTDREEQILALLAEGRKNREIAESLFISRETVRWHMRAIYSKLGIHDRQSAASYAIARNPKPMTRLPGNSHHSLAI